MLFESHELPDDGNLVPLLEKPLQRRCPYWYWSGFQLYGDFRAP